MTPDPEKLSKAIDKVRQFIDDKKIPLTKVSEKPMLDLLDEAGKFCDAVAPSGGTTVTGGGLEALYQIALALLGSTDPVVVSEIALDEAIKHLGCERGILVEVDKDGGMAIRVARGVGDDEAHDISSTLVAAAVESGEGIIFDSTDGVASESLVQRQVTSSLLAPFAIDIDRFGVIYVDSRDPAVRLGETELQFLQRVADLAAPAMSSAIRVTRDLESGRSGAFGHVTGSSPEIARLVQRARRVARTDENVLLLGESGTGKEIFARAIHAESKRAKGPFEAINCSAIPDELLESELFGYVEGAFTGAKKQGKPGIFELANNGTLFLDEIGDMPALLQAKLLRVLQERKIRRVGDTKDIHVDVRVIAATHQDLDKRMEDGSFREDLYYRLSTFPLYIPPLRKRGNDILELADFFLDKYSSEYEIQKPSMSPKAAFYFLEYPWKGNIREMENLLKRILIDHEPKVIHPKHLPPEMIDAQESAISDFPTLEELDHQHVLKALNLVKGNRSKAANLLEISEATLYRWINEMKKKGVWPGDDVGPEKD